MKKSIAAALLLSVLLSVICPAAMAAEKAESTQIGTAAGDLLSDLGDKIRSGGKDLWSAFKEYVSEHTSSEVADHLKTIFRETENLTDEELREELRTVTKQLSITLSDSQLSMLVKLCRRLEKLDVERLRQQAEEWKNNAPDWDDIENALDKLEEVGQRAQETAREVRGFLGQIKNFFRQVQDFFHGLFG